METAIKKFISDLKIDNSKNYDSALFSELNKFFKKWNKPKDKDKVKKSPNPWIKAISEWNQKRDNGMRCIPTKGTKEYAEVKQLMDSYKSTKSIPKDTKATKSIPKDTKAIKSIPKDTKANDKLLKSQAKYIVKDLVDGYDEENKAIKKIQEAAEDYKRTLKDKMHGFFRFKVKKKSKFMLRLANGEEITLDDYKKINTGKAISFTDRTKEQPKNKMVKKKIMAYIQDATKKFNLASDKVYVIFEGRTEQEKERLRQFRNRIRESTPEPEPEPKPEPITVKKKRGRPKAVKK